MLRNPAEMAHSLYGLYRRTGNEDLPSFAEALAAEDERREGRRIPEKAYFPEGLRYVEAALAADKLESFFAEFGRDRVRVVLYEDFRRDNLKVYREVLEFLGIDPDFVPELDPARAADRIREIAGSAIAGSFRDSRIAVSRLLSAIFPSMRHKWVYAGAE